jgi:segregation and condensation protein A
VSDENDPKPAEPAAPLSEAEQLLGPDVKSPVGIPKAYKPTEVSTHELLRIELGDFAGPMDLLLYLIRQHDLDIFNIPISFITERYLAMLDAASALPIDVAAEFLVMAAELAHIKSKMLLPPKEGVPVEGEPEEEVDPRLDLVRRLLEYQKYRGAADQLGEQAQLGRDVFTRAVTGDKAEVFDPGFRDTSIFRLVEAMADVLARLTPEKQHEVIADTLTIAECIERVLAFGEANGNRFSFLALLTPLKTRREVVVTFLAILEMARTRMLRVVQSAEAVVPAPPLPETASDEPKERIPLDPPRPGPIELELTGFRPALAQDSFEYRAFEDAPDGGAGPDEA